MKGEQKKKRLLAEKRRNRRALLQALVAAIVGPGLLIWLVLSVPQLGSPKDMVKTQIVHGRSIKPPAGSEQTPGLTNMSTDVVASGGRDYSSVSFDQLASFPFVVTPDIADATADSHLASVRTGEQLPGAIKLLNDHRVAITGFMLPVEVWSGVTSNFLLLRNQTACCYGIAPRVNEWVVVHTTGKGVKPVMDVPVTALGTLHVGDVREEGQLLGIYELDCDQLLTKQ